MSRSIFAAGERIAYLPSAALLIGSQHAVVWALSSFRPALLELDTEFWLTPLRRVLEMPELSPTVAALLFAFSLAIAWALAALSFRQATRIGWGFPLAVFSVVPVVQLAAIPALALLPSRRSHGDAPPPPRGGSAGIVHGLLAGVAIVVFAVLISAVTFGAYGWGLFVITPFSVGIATGYLVNCHEDQGGSRTMTLVIAAAGLGSLALLVLALEGIVCILLAAPLAIPFVMAGGAIGRSVAVSRFNRRSPLASVAMLPLIFMAEAATPPSVTIAAAREIDIAATPAAVWAALISPEPIRTRPGLTAAAGLAYPVAGRLAAAGVGALRLGTFSTGIAKEVVTEWKPGRALAFRVLSQPPAMEEMSPYRRVHAPHLVGYFETGETRFDLISLERGRTRLKITAEHRLRIDPVPYWEPIARWAIRENVDRVLQDVRVKALTPSPDHARTAHLQATSRPTTKRAISSMD